MTNEEIERQLAHHRQLIEGLNERIANIESWMLDRERIDLKNINLQINNIKLILNHLNERIGQ